MHHHASGCFIKRPARHQRYDITLKETDNQIAGHPAECIAFANAVAEGGESPVPSVQSLAVQKILVGLYESQEAGREVRFDGT